MLLCYNIYMHITLNGNPEIILANTNINSLLALKKINPKGVVVELNGSIIKATAWETTILPEEAQIELITFVGGG